MDGWEPGSRDEQAAPPCDTKVNLFSLKLLENISLGWNGYRPRGPKKHMATHRAGSRTWHGHPRGAGSVGSQNATARGLLEDCAKVPERC